MSIDPKCPAILCSKGITTKREALKALKEISRNDPTSTSAEFKQISHCLEIFDKSSKLDCDYIQPVASPQRQAQHPGFMFSRSQPEHQRNPPPPPSYEEEQAYEQEQQRAYQQQQQRAYPPPPPSNSQQGQGQRHASSSMPSPSNSQKKRDSLYQQSKWTRYAAEPYREIIDKKRKVGVGVGEGEGEEKTRTYHRLVLADKFIGGRICVL